MDIHEGYTTVMMHELRELSHGLPGRNAGLPLLHLNKPGFCFLTSLSVLPVLSHGGSYFLTHQLTHNIFSEKFTNMNTSNVLALGLLISLNCAIYQGAITLHTDWES